MSTDPINDRPFADIFTGRTSDVAKGLWEEYSYRHDMIWKLVFRVTAVATALVIAPFLLDSKAQRAVGGWLAVLPALAVIVVVLGLLALPSEFRHFNRVSKTYQSFQHVVFRELPWWRTPELRDPSSFVGRFRQRHQWLRFGFRFRIYSFLAIVLAGAILFLVLFLFEWKDEITK